MASLHLIKYAIFYFKEVFSDNHHFYISGEHGEEFRTHCVLGLAYLVLPGRRGGLHRRQRGRRGKLFQGEPRQLKTEIRVVDAR